MFQKLLKWFLSFFKRERLYKHQYVNYVPEKINSNTIYLVGNEGYYWQAVMLCPCGCDKTLNMSLMKEHHPSWNIKFNSDRIITLHPSINRTVGCKSHFFLRNGKIVWA